MKLLKWVGGGLLGVAALCGLTASLALVLAGSDTRAHVAQAFFGPAPDGRDPSWHTAGGEELLRANNDHFNIALQISRCFPDVDLALGTDELPGKISVAFMLNTQPNGEQSWGNVGVESPDIKLTNFQRAVLTISRSASVTRTELATSATQIRSTMLLYQWLTVIIGAMTTILVSIRSMSHETTENKTFFVIGILAVIFSAVGTALASINSFEGPNDAYIRSERALLQVRQAHLDLALQVAEERNLCIDFDLDKPDDPRGKRLSDLATRLREVSVSAGFNSNSNAQSGATSIFTTSSATGH